jgi:hypothetical protein
MVLLEVFDGMAEGVVKGTCIQPDLFGKVAFRCQTDLPSFSVINSMHQE